jgi:phosphate:Na+ symporter
MRYGLQRALWHRLHYALVRLTLTSWRSLAVGTVAATLLQGSTAVSLITIGLVSADYLTFYQSLGIILGANIGTCSTVQLMTLALPERYLIPLLIILLITSLIWHRLRYILLGMAGLVSMFLGIGLTSQALAAISQFDTALAYIVAARSNPLYGIAGGIIITLLFQSSSAATGMLMLLANENIIDLTTAAYVVYGNNIGSCLSSVIVGAAAPLAAKRVAMAHILLNVLGVMIFFPITKMLIILATHLTVDFAGQVAAIHTIFNIISSLAVIPFLHGYAALIIHLVPDPKC